MIYCKTVLSPEDFLDHQYPDPMNTHSRIFTAMLQCPIAHEVYIAQKLDALKLLRKGDIGHLFQCTSENVHFVYDEYADIVKEYANKRLGIRVVNIKTVPISRDE
jgi:hypothetical protein